MSAQHQSDAAAMVSGQLADGCHVPHCDAMAIRSLSDRDFRIDLFRGLSLWLIFLDHIPETYLNHLTPKNAVVLAKVNRAADTHPCTL
jgi:hypothetical protein